jgi:Tol biopolymer transport system component
VFVLDSATPEIGLTNAYGEGTSVINVAAAGGVAHPVMAPNGTKIAFSSKCAIYTVNTDGTDITALPNATGGCAEHPAWAPGSAQIAFDTYAQATQDVWVSNVDGTNPVEVAQGSSPTWAPSGTQIAFVSVNNLSTVSSAGGPATVRASVPPSTGSIGGSTSRLPHGLQTEPPSPM